MSLALGFNAQNVGESSNKEIRLTIAAPQRADLSYLYAALSQHLNLLALAASSEMLRSSRARLANNVQHHTWEAIAEVAANFYKVKGAALADKFARKGFILDSTSFEAELKHIQRHHDAIAAASLVSL